MYWLLKSEPKTFGIDDLRGKPQGKDNWDGVRNYQARNFLKAMQPGELAFFYHSNCSIPGIVGLMQITRSAFPDKTAFAPTSPYYDPKSTVENPRWVCVEVQWLRSFRETIALKTLREISELCTLHILKKGSRLSVTPITAQEWTLISRLTDTR
jgi:predicted RNA-binding protein with PUA-like domain